MKVLLLSLLHPELMRGGAQQVAYELFSALRARKEKDIQPILLCAIDESFSAFYKSGARIVGFDGRENEFLFLTRGYDYAWHRLNEPSLIESYSEFLRLTKPDVVHFHHFLLFGFELISVTRKVLPEARIVFTFHEFLTICDARGHMVRLNDGSLCTHASPARCHQCFPERGPEQFFTRELWIKRHLAAVDAFTTPTRFMIERFTAWGIDPNRIQYVTNGQPDYRAAASRPQSRIEHRKMKNRFGFFGQIIDAKGVHIVMRAVSMLRAMGFGQFSIEINGDNISYASKAVREEIENFLAQEAKLPFADRIVHFGGSYTVDQLPQRMARVDWCIVPSIWWEAFALVISEAWMFGRPVIASDIGAMAERVTHDVDGLLFAVGDPSSLAQTMLRAATEQGLWERLSTGIQPPPPVETMCGGFVKVYRNEKIIDEPVAPPPIRDRKLSKPDSRLGEIVFRD